MCLAHKVRNLNYAIECDNTQVMKTLQLLLKEAMLDHKLDLLQEQREVLKEQYLLMFDKLLKIESIPQSETQKQLNSFKKAKIKYLHFYYIQMFPLIIMEVFKEQ